MKGVCGPNQANCLSRYSRIRAVTSRLAGRGTDALVVDINSEPGSGIMTTTLHTLSVWPYFFTKFMERKQLCRFGAFYIAWKSISRAVNAKVKRLTSTLVPQVIKPPCLTELRGKDKPNSILLIRWTRPHLISEFKFTYPILRFPPCDAGAEHTTRRLRLMSSASRLWRPNWLTCM